MTSAELAVVSAQQLVLAPHVALVPKSGTAVRSTLIGAPDPEPAGMNWSSPPGWESSQTMYAAPRHCAARACSVVPTGHDAAAAAAAPSRRAARRQGGKAIVSGAQCASTAAPFPTEPVHRAGLLL